MTVTSESLLRRAEAYRAARRAFIAACEAQGVDAIARLHPSRAADGKPLFIDTAALGPRHAAKALLVTARDQAGSAILTALLREGVKPSAEARLVLVHALDPAAFAGAAEDPHWPAAMLAAMATEDLARVRELGVLPLVVPETLVPVLAKQLTGARIALLPPAADFEAARAAIGAFFAS